MLASWPEKASEPPPLGPKPERRSGATTMKPCGGELVGHLFGPVGEAEDLVDEDDDGGLVLDLGIDDEGLDGAVAVLEGDVLAVARRGFEAGLGPVLRVGGDGEETSRRRARSLRGWAHGRSV